MFEEDWRQSQYLVRMIGQRRMHLPAIVKRLPIDLDCECPPEWFEVRHGAPERRIGRFQQAVHFGGEPRRHIPVVGFGQDAVAAGEFDVAELNPLVLIKFQAFALLGRNRFVDAANEPARIFVSSASL